ncbi:MAG: tRNA pseudouridine(55) synthase TruB [Oscillospiraceae bacterium]|jgi:tRNA pseudouridine55 synthase|nr:tRNA pseudouridine(55) synthase TruB [Oscillospiraceae bacterium]
MELSGPSGILAVDKPAGHTSFDVVARIRGIFKTRRVGHGGTLDPDATGVLPVFLGKATRFIDLVPNQDKRYIATVRLGVVTDTRDLSGAVIKESPVGVTREELVAAISSFVGKGEQIPPMYSAVRKDGVRLYDLARRGIEVERSPRPVTFYEINLLDFEGASFTIDVKCSKGAYIRVLCHDLGEMLGCGAAMAALRRTEACGLGLSSCKTLPELEELARAGSLADALMPAESAFGALPRAELTPEAAKRFADGIRLPFDGEGARAVFGPRGFMGLANAENGLLMHIRVF